jgi:L-alanine-DL-glutamate epimerase-like enolase superfamily enzyme
MPRITLEVASETLQLKAPFRISGHVFETSDVVVVTVRDGELSGRGEGCGVYYLRDDVEHMLEDIESAREFIKAGVTREELRLVMPAGGGRNAVDCALWELEAARTGQSAWAMAGEPSLKPLLTTFTLGADAPEAMAKGARDYADARAIKIKLTGDLALDVARVAAVREARPDIWLGVDGNQGFARSDLDELVDALVASDVKLLEQPLARGHESELENFKSAIPIAGDESLLTLADLPSAPGRFDVVNIKLDKCGGLTEGLLMAAEARRLGLQVMVGTMVGTSLSTAPALILGQQCDIVDLDGPTFLADDRLPAVDYIDGMVSAAPEVWGSGKVLTA